MNSPSRVLLDLGLWFSRNTERDSLQEGCRGRSLIEIYSDLNLRPWAPFRPWKVEYNGVGFTETVAESARERIWETSGGTLKAGWILGPDGDWWQSAYPVKSSADLPLAAEVIRSMSWRIDREAAGNAPPRPHGTYIELPMRPYSELLHSFLGWDEGLMIAMEEEEQITGMADAMEAKYSALVEDLLDFPESDCLAPDNLDGNFISPAAFESQMAAGYRNTADALHRAGKKLFVHIGGNARRLLGPLAECGVDCLEGICGPPQGDASIPEARQLCGPSITLWGGLAQDFLLPSCGEDDFRAACASALEEVAADGRAILGAADRVPPDALFTRIRYLAEIGVNREF
jgi:hypothetical protein